MIFEATRANCLAMSRQKLFTLTTSEHSATVLGLLTDHNQGIDQENGNAINARNAHASVHEDELTAKGFESLKLMNAIIQDGTKKYKVAQTMPNTTTGLIVCILKDSK